MIHGQQTAYERVLERLSDVRVGANGAMAICLAHDDHNPSLSISKSDNGVLIYCHAGCTTEAVLEAIGMEPRELFDDPKHYPNSNGGGRWLPRRLEWVESYEYRDAHGTSRFEVIRALDPNGEKAFVQRRPDPSTRSGWAWKVSDLPAVDRALPYRLPEVLKAIQEGKPVWIAEGEKDVDALCESGVTATCNAGGAGKWTSHHAKHLSGADVVITRDEDKAGVRHQEIVAHSLEEVAKSVRLVAPAAGNDATDHLAAGFSVDDFVPVDVGGHEQGLNEENANRHSQGFGSAAKSATMSGSPDSWYESRPAGLFHVRERAGRDGEVEVTSTLLSNFTAQIVASTEIDDGAEVERRLDIEATVAGRKRTASIPASEFTRMDWVIPKLGPDAIIQAGARIKDHARAAIQAVSEPAEVRVMRQTGWRQVDGQWLYLHSSGAIGANGPVDDIEVNLPRTLAKYTLPEPGGTDAVRASLDMLDVAPDRIMWD